MSDSASDVGDALTIAISGTEAKTVARWALAAHPDLDDAIGGIFATIVDRALLVRCGGCYTCFPLFAYFVFLCAGYDSQQ